MKIAVITGTMPDIIKQAPIVWEAEKRGHQVIIIHTNQHSMDKYREIAMPIGLRDPDYIMPDPFSIANTIVQMLWVERIYSPDIILPHGDTTTSMASAVGAHHLGLPVGHVEAGLRTGSREPWPEQTNTRITDACSNLFFAPTELAARNLAYEGFHHKDILVTGNTVVDAAYKVASTLPDSTLSTPNTVYFSAHREENMRFPDRVASIVKFSTFLCNEGLDVQWVMRRKTEKVLQDLRHELDPRITVIPSLPYTESIALLANCKFVCTDSGGLQEEASALHIPCLTMRYVTDRPETITAGCNLVTTLDIDSMKEAYHNLLANYQTMKSIPCPYGSGDSAKRILNLIEAREGKFIRWE
jgi:UDP-N-acetylglucosamine 2-epimerase (non-hydrolysing)